MKTVFFFIFWASLFMAFPALAQNPCPSDLPTQSVENGGCQANMDAPPTHFDFDALQKQMQDSDNQKDDQPTSVDVPAPSTPQMAAENTRPTPTTCTYTAYAWDTVKKRSTNHFSVSKPYSEVTNDERDPSDPRCTICSEDQVTIDTAQFGLKTGKIRICYAYADNVASALKTIAESGQFDIEKLEGYRPGRTRGPIDANGLRTLWSNHSFGAAIDINAHKNAIYSQCPNPIKGSRDDVLTCKRGIGGSYDPQKNPRTSITRDGIVYQTMTTFWKWGGEIEGDTKDIMHFSITGY